MSTKSNQKSEVLFLIFLSFLWGSSFTLNEVAIDSVPPATVVLGRLVIGAAILLIVARLRGIAVPVKLSLWGAFLVQGFLQSALPFTLSVWGQKHIDSGLAGLLNALPPLFTFLITYLVLGDRRNARRNAIGVTVGFVGIFATLGPDVIADRTGAFGAKSLSSDRVSAMRLPPFMPGGSTICRWS